MLVIQCEQDEIIPIELGRSVYEAAPGPKFWCPVPGAGLNNCYLVGGLGYFDRLTRFVASASQ